MIENYLALLDKIDFSKIKDHPNILIAASFWDEDRYRAAKICYKYMRAIDDLIDCHKSIHTKIAENEKEQFLKNVNSWLELSKNTDIINPLYADLQETIRKFLIPAWPMEAFAKSMIYDIDHDGFNTLDDFLEYCKGATVAPAAIFVHLSGLVKNNKEYLFPCFEVRQAATPCAIFSYLVHIIRDFQKDQENNLNYFARDVMNRYGLNDRDLRKIAFGGEVTSGFRDVISEYYNLADKYRLETFNVINNIWPCVEPRYRLGLLIIFNLYLMVFERIDVKSGNFTTKELNPSTEEVKKRVYETILNFK